jgi:putative endonuclease
MKKVHRYFVYILASRKGGTLYIGLTNNLEVRAFNHKNETVDGFTKKYKVKRLVYFEEYQYINDAINREKNLKKWNRDWKIRLIEEVNPDWNEIGIF